MPKRKVIFANNEVYHVFNRSIGGEEMFSDKRKLRQILRLFDYYRFPSNLKFSWHKKLCIKEREKRLVEMKSNQPLVKIYAFCFMPDHYHFLIRQKSEGGIVKFISNIQNSYAHYYNLKNERTGGLFQSPFKAKRVYSDEVLLHVSRYIHLNPVSSCLLEIEDLCNYPYTSYPQYYGKQKLDFVDTSLVIKMVGSSNKYIKFVENNADYQRSLKRTRTALAK